MTKPTGKPRGRPTTEQGTAKVRNIRISDMLWELIVRAAEIQGKGHTTFIREAAEKEARRVVGQR